ncbi:Protein LSM12, partial [Nestor notabilis]
ECPSSSGKPNHADILLVNLQYVSEVEIINDRTETPPPLASLNVSKVRAAPSAGNALFLLRIFFLLDPCVSPAESREDGAGAGVSTSLGCSAEGPLGVGFFFHPQDVEKHFRDVESQKVMQRSQAQQPQKETPLSS